MREITALSRLDHPHIVRYVTCWIQEEDGSDDKGGTSSSETMTSSMSRSFHAEPGGSTDEEEFAVFGADDFLSLGHDAFSKSASYPSIRFAGSDDDSDSSSDEASSSSSSGSRSSSIRASRMSQSQVLPAGAESQPPRPRSLYIQMEYVEGATLREALDRGLSVEESWSIFRMCLEALAHVSSLGLIHRDLKPANLLLLPSGDVRVADFGLATTQLAEGAQGTMGTADQDLTGDGDLTSDIGTNLYISPEAMTGARYNHKVDMYSLGITFFEMLASGTVYKTGMERLSVIRDLRSPSIKFPSAWPTEKLENQTKIITWLLDHDPDKRPTPVSFDSFELLFCSVRLTILLRDVLVRLFFCICQLELLKSDLLPPKLEDEYVEETLRLMSNPSSAYNHRLLEALFGRTEIDDVRDFTFETGAESNEDNRLVSVVCDLLRGIFHRHGALELHAPLLMPPNEVYLNGERKPVQLLDKTGKVVLLPYDL